MGCPTVQVVSSVAVDKLLKLSKKVKVGVQNLKAAGSALNLKDYREMLSDLAQDIEQFGSIWQEFLGVSHTFVEQVQAFLHSADYATQMTAALESTKIPYSGTFPNYEIPPFTLSIKLNQSLAKLSLGKKSFQTYALAPNVVAAWVEEKYKALRNRPFTQDRFCQELLSAYTYLHQGQWGTPVPLREVYRLLTLKAEVRQEYPETHFIFDLGRLLEQYEIVYADYRFDFSSHKESKKNYTVVNQQGRERAIGMMSIYPISQATQDMAPRQQELLH